MVKWIKASKGSRHISVVSSVEGMALKVGIGGLVDLGNGPKVVEHPRVQDFWRN